MSIFPSPRTQRTLRRGEGRSTEAGEEWHEAVSSGHDTRTHCSCSHPHKTCSKSGFSTPFHGTRNSPWGSTPNWLVTVNGGWRTVVTFFSGVVTDKLPTLPWTTSYSCSCNPNLTLWVTCTQKTWKCVCVCGTCWEESFQQGRMRKGNRLKGTEIHSLHACMKLSMNRKSDNKKAILSADWLSFTLRLLLWGCGGKPQVKEGG